MIAWPAHFLASLESPLAIIAKLAWFNETTPYEFMQRFYAMPSCSRAFAPSVRSWRETSWLEDLVWQGRIAEPEINGVTLKQLLMACPAREARLFYSASHDLFRSCEQCIHAGLHADLHQDKFLERCPLHDAPLRFGCVACRAPLHFAVVPGEKGFWCSQCDSNRLEFAIEARQHLIGSLENSSAAILAIYSCPNIVIPEGIYASVDGDKIRETAALLPWLCLDVPRSPLAHFIAARPYGFDTHHYESSDGGLLQVNWEEISSQLQFSLELLEVVEDVARDFMLNLGYEHPCLAKPLGDLSIVDSVAGKACVLGDAGWCPVAIGYGAWFRGASAIVDRLGSNRLGDGFSHFSGNLDDLRVSLRTELHRCTYATMLSRRANPKKYLGEIPNFQMLWCHDGVSGEPSRTTFVRPSLEYGELFKEQPCIVEHLIRSPQRRQGAKS